MKNQMQSSLLRAHVPAADWKGEMILLHLRDQEEKGLARVQFTLVDLQHES